MVQNMARFIDPTISDELTDFFSRFSFSINGFGKWVKQVSEPRRRGFIVDYQLMHIEQGQLRFKIHEQEHVCPPGSFILFEPFVVYTIQNETPESLVCYKIHFDILPEFRKNVFFTALTHGKGNMFLAHEMANLEGIYFHLYESAQKKQLGVMAEVESVLRLALLHMLRARWVPGESAGDEFSRQRASHNFDREVDVVAQSIHYIQEHLGEPIRISAISRMLAISENYLYKCFMEVLQTPPSQYILQYKIRRSIEMMLANDLTIEEVAARLGFSSLHHFSKTFKQMLGTSPRNYMKSLRDDS